MAIRTQESLSGFIASDPQLTYTERGDARFYARFGQENFQREEDGSFTKLEPSFGNLVLYRATAERAFERFTKGDQFVAEGYAHEYTYERDRQSIAGEEFVAKKIGHDTARTRYDVDRTPRQAMNRDATGQAFEPPRQSAPATTSLSM
ncbi:single-stranded DNA-binding protein [Cutibacterium sp. WCA-380-WT-3A]|uniref:Single-stranded DNA-binding protein n=1 Tax=Cutibacterium porci TaxID=2605781 RepID=A0A7K0J5H1_9ACTN|nr:single-stranded DNA-binding protein [Cutibacterium porci]MSS45163.1 single-stranded DNA-binding protein [Cutibacterium porci]